MGRHELYQLLGYLLADTDNEYGIMRVGFAALRRRRSHFWSANEFLDELACQPGAFELEEKRAEFAQLLAPMASQREGEMRRRLLRRQAGIE